MHHTWKLHFLPQLVLCVLSVHLIDRSKRSRGGLILEKIDVNTCTVTYNHHFRSLCKTYWSIKRALIWDYKFSCCEFPCISRFFPFSTPYLLKNQENAFVPIAKNIQRRTWEVDSVKRSLQDISSIFLEASEMALIAK